MPELAAMISVMYRALTDMMQKNETLNNRAGVQSASVGVFHAVLDVVGHRRCVLEAFQVVADTDQSYGIK